jgi:hypothetical protein
LHTDILERKNRQICTKLSKWDTESIPADETGFDTVETKNKFRLENAKTRLEKKKQFLVSSATSVSFKRVDCNCVYEPFWSQVIRNQNDGRKRDFSVSVNCGPVSEDRRSGGHELAAGRIRCCHSMTRSYSRRQIPASSHRLQRGTVSVIWNTK